MLSLTEESLEGALTRQKDLEDTAVSLGVESFRKKLLAAQQSKRSAAVGAAKKLLQEGLEPLAKTLAAMCGEQRRGRRHIAEKWVKLIGTETAAYLTLQTALNQITASLPVRQVALEISDRIVDELRYRRFREQAPHLFQYKLSSFHTSSYAHMSRSMDAAISQMEIDTSDLEILPAERLQVGIKLIDALITSTGLVKVEHVRAVEHGSRRGRPKVEALLVAVPETLTWISERNAATEALRPVAQPMLVPPLPWAQDRRGGYRFALREKYPMVRGIRKDHAEKLKKTPMPVVYAALNRIQETAWRINPSILALVRQIVEVGGGIAGIPRTQPVEKPIKPPDIDTNEEARKSYRKKAHAAHEAEHERKLRCKTFADVLTVAERFEKEAAIWFPFNLDFRGRIYPMVPHLHPQGDDLQKALLTFAEGKPLGPDGIGWLALHGANCLGTTPDAIKLSKQTLQERVDWIVAHSTEIVQAAEAPLENLWWASADDPLEFYAFCVEWAGFCRMERQGKGEEYVCSLPCAMDGSCNGLQHFSALLRDPIGGRAVNVIPTDRPEDIYQRIADAVLERLEQEASTNELARLWLQSGLVNRKLAKRPTMTFGYGSKKFGFRKQLIDYLKHLDNWKEIAALFSAANEEGKVISQVPAACGYMAALIWDALSGIVVAAAQGMAWMQKAARLIVSHGLRVEWSVPGTGFPVRQDYMEAEEKVVNTVLCGTAFRPRDYVPTGKPHKAKQSNAVAPNIVHSLDAAALQRTVLEASAAGVESFGMIHDSYATVPADCPVLAQCTRQAFFALYTERDVITELSAQFAAQVEQVGGDLAQFPVLPPPGELSLSGVLASDYFFA